MITKIQIRRGLEVNLPILSSGEFGLCTDTKRVYIGTDTGNVLIYPASSTGGGVSDYNDLLNKPTLFSGNYNDLLNRPTIPNVPEWALETIKPAYSKTEIGLGNVDNTADNTKNVLSASKLTTPRKINNVLFTGESDITIDTVKFEVRTTNPIDLYEGRVWVLKKSTTPNASPTAPVISLGTIGDTTINIVLTTASTDTEDGVITLYNVYKGGTLHASNITLVQGSTYQLTGLTGGTPYSITLKAVDSIGTLSVASNTLSPTTTGGNTAPTIPTGLASSNITQTGFTLSWTASTDAQGNAITYKVYKGGTLYQSGVSATSLAITGQTASSTATWTVSATDGTLDSAQSTGLSVTTSAPVSLLDQHNDYSSPVTTSQALLTSNTGTVSQAIAVSFIPTMTNPIDKIEFWARWRSDASPAGQTTNYNVRIETDNAGVPSGILAHASLDVVVTGDLNDVFHMMTADFTSTFNPTVGTKYHIVFRNTTPSVDGVYTSIAMNSDTTLYSGVTNKIVSAPWATHTGGDVYFKEYVVG